jgi:hypothetical protein
MIDKGSKAVCYWFVVQSVETDVRSQRKLMPVPAWRVKR